jgi:hypothetical protein
MGELFDLERLRKKWAAEPAPPAAKISHPKLEVASLPRETLDEARESFARLAQTIARDFPAQKALLAPFMQQANELFAQLASGEGDKRALSAELDVTLSQIDDLLCLFAFPPRTF